MPVQVEVFDGDWPDYEEPTQYTRTCLPESRPLDKSANFAHVLVLCPTEVFQQFTEDTNT